MNCTLNDNDRKKVRGLIKRWHSCTEVWENEFNLNDVQIIEKETYDWFIKFHDADMLPKAIVSLLMTVHSFAAEAPYARQREILAAMLTAESICNVLNWKEPTDENQEEKLQPDLIIKIRGVEKFHVIDTDTFDLGELVADIRVG